MQDFRSFFKGKKITVMGLGLLGRGVGDAIFLAECGAELTITDLKPSTLLRPSLEKLRKYKNIKYVLGEHRLEDFKNCDMVLKAAGVPMDSPYIIEAKKNKVPVEMSASLFAELSGLPMIGITGTRGKSTTTHLIAHILETAGKKIILGGNIRGVSNLSLLKESEGKELAVFELDSWQLQGMGDRKISPHIAVFTTFFPDHMGYYESNMEKYFSDKAQIFKYQKNTDIVIVGSQAEPFVEKWGGKIESRIIVPKEGLPSGWKLGIPGEHNIYNAALAVEAARSIGIKDEIIGKALASFEGVESRMQFIREVSGIKYYNDTTATTPEATIAALRTLGAGRKIILIAGGFDKGLNMDILVEEITKYCKGAVLLSGSGTDRVKDKIKNSTIVDSMEKAVLKAQELAEKGDTVLLSPAFASYGMFNNEFERGDQFMKIVKSLK